MLVANPPAFDASLDRTDEELLADFRRSGDREALDRLLGRYLRPVRAVVFAMVVDHSTADDLTQEIFLRALGHLDSYRGEARFSTWLYRLAMNATYSTLRKGSSQRLEYRAEVPEREGSGAGTEQAVLYAELDGQIASALATLSPKMRAVIVLTAIRHNSVAEVAEIESCSQATVYWRLHKARRALKRRLRGYFT